MTHLGVRAFKQAKPRSRATLLDMPEPSQPTSSRLVLMFAGLTLVVAHWLSTGSRWIFYPFTLLGTWVHEMGHGITALLVGGSFSSLDVFADASGLAHVSYSPGLASALVAAGGLLAPPAVGAAILALARGPRRAQIILWALSITIAISLLFWVRSLAGWLVMPLLALAIAAFARYGNDKTRLFVAQLLGLLLALDTWKGLGYLFTPSAVIDGVTRTSDIQAIADALLLPYPIWGALLAIISLGLLGAGLVFAFRPNASATQRKIPSLGVPSPTSLRIGDVGSAHLDEEEDTSSTRSSSVSARRK
ncbi:MAG: M50 family metallopeptidase [Polyangiaceae bacterium]